MNDRVCPDPDSPEQRIAQLEAAVSQLGDRLTKLDERVADFEQLREG
jgi:hypothetical protein